MLSWPFGGGVFLNTPETKGALLWTGTEVAAGTEIEWEFITMPLGLKE